MFNIIIVFFFLTCVIFISRYSCYCSKRCMFYTTGDCFHRCFVAKFCVSVNTYYLSGYCYLLHHTGNVIFITHRFVLLCSN